MNNKLITKSIKWVTKIIILVFGMPKKDLTGDQRVIARHLKDVNGRFKR